MHIHYEIRNQAFFCTRLYNLQFFLHLHKECELVYITDGCLHMTIGEKEIELHKGDLAIAFPDVPHSYRSSDACAGILLIFDPTFVPDFASILKSKSPSEPYLFRPHIHPDVRYNLSSMMENPDSDAKRLRANLSIILSRIAEQIMFVDRSRNHANPIDGKNRLQQLLSYIYENFRENLSLEQVADAVGLNKYHISHLFSEKIGSGFIQYIHSLRIEHACNLLRLTDTSVTQIAYEAGFESTSTFHRTFHKLVGTTPLQYRKNQKNLPMLSRTGRF